MHWQQILRQNITSWKQLYELIELAPPAAHIPSFPINIPLRLAQKIEKNNDQDPILKQFVPSSAEQQTSPLYSIDPLAEQQATCTEKSLQKYNQRILLITTQACAMHCRYCFRQHFNYAKKKGFTAELAHIQQDLSLREVILSGGDPLSLNDTILKELIQQLSTFSHLKRLRFHTRFPIGIPERITSSFLEILSACSLQTWFVIHCNHPREFDTDIFNALKTIQRYGIPILNQAVLLKGINDSVEILQELCETLVDHGITPYYLHQLDCVQGAAHFAVSKEKGCRLIETLRTRISGYAIPTYVQEIPHTASKSILI